MTTTLRTTEADLLAVFRRYMAHVSPTSEQFTEQLFNYAGQQRKLDLVLDDEQTLTVIAGKELLDDTAIEQAREMLAHCDASYIVCRKPERHTDQQNERLERCHKLGIGVAYIRGERVISVVIPCRYPMADPQHLRRQLRHREVELDAGIAGGGTNDTTDFFRTLGAALEHEGRIRMARASQYAKLPKGWTKTKAINEIKRHVETGQFNARVDGQYITK